MPLKNLVWKGSGPVLDGKYFVIDAHCHIYPEKIASRAAKNTGDFYGEIPYADGTVDAMLSEGLAAGIDHFVVQSVATTPHQVKSINEFIAVSVAQSDGRMTGLGTLHPDSEDQTADVQHLKELGLHGVKLHPDIQNFKVDDERCMRIYEICQRENLPLLVHTGDHRYDNSNPDRVLDVLKAFSNLIMVGAHFGGWSVWEEATQKLAHCPNLYVDCSSTMMYRDTETVEKMIKAYGADRVLFGTDYPLWSSAEELSSFGKLNLSEEEKRLILSENARKIYGCNV